LADKLALYLDLVHRVLTGLAKVRLASGAWLDSESEEEARETQVFKIGECLRPFYLAQQSFPQGGLLLPQDILHKDTEFFLKQITKFGFFPSPYSPIPGSGDQYTDFAAFVLDFSGLVHQFWRDKSPSSQRIVNQSRLAAERAIEFLLDPHNCFVDDNGCRWGGTNKYKRVRRTEEFYTDTYFTSVVALALNGAIESPLLNLSKSRKEDVRNRICLAVNWIADRFDGACITGDEAKSNRKLLYTTWGLRALIETRELQDGIVSKRILQAVTNAYLDLLRERHEFNFEQEYLTILSEEVDQPLYYEDRSGLGGILLTLARLRDVPDLEGILEATSYPRLLERVFNSVMSLRNPGTGLWYNQQLTLSSHSYLTEAFLLLHHGKDVVRNLEVSGYLIRTAIKETLTDETIISSLQQAVVDRLLRLMENAERSRAIEESFMKIVPAKQRTRPQNKSSSKVKRSKKGVGRPKN
jgi:hypothetical protein